ncbi:MAG: hypothetical protein R3292_05410 [Alcanivorax sp.]|nr:hypothetical protein [Alcanivorax sp.]
MNSIIQGAGIFNFGRQIGGALGVNLCALCIQFFSDRYRHADPLASSAVAYEAGFDNAFWFLLLVFLLACLPLMAMARG